MEKELVDPDNEYIKICKYEFCKKRFKANHMLESYCPEKDGVPHYCKNRQKRLNDQKKKEEREAINAISIGQPLPPIVPAEPVLMPKSPIMDANQQKASQRDMTMKFIISNLGANKSIDVLLETVEAFGIDLTGFDRKQFLPGEKRYMLVFGRYGVKWQDDDLIRLINLI